MQAEKTTNKCRKILANELNFPYWDTINIKTVEKFFDRIPPYSNKGEIQFWEFKQNYHKLIQEEKQKVLEDKKRQLLKSRVKAKTKKYYKKEIEKIIPSTKVRRKLYNLLEIRRIQQGAKLPNAVLKHYLDKTIKKYSSMQSSA